MEKQKEKSEVLQQELKQERLLMIQEKDKQNQERIN